MSQRPTTHATHSGRAAFITAVFSLSLGLALAVVPEAEAAHPFYEQRLSAGALALEQGRPAEAARELKIAAFGLLDEPPRLLEALVRLALAQARLEDASGFRSTVRRLVEVEERFKAYRDAAISATERAALARQIVAWTPADQLRQMPSLQRLFVADFLNQPELDRPELDEPMLDEPQAEPPAARADRASSESAPPQATDEDPREESAVGPRGDLTPAEQAQVDRARDILTTARQVQDLRAALDLARPLADAHPDRSDLQRLVGEIEYRSRNWEQAIRYLRRGGDPLPERPELLFYLAVSLYESGRPNEASTPLRQALPRLERTAFVEEYVAKIFGASSGPGSGSSGGAP